jgi:large subunit ribosomal protein L6
MEITGTGYRAAVQGKDLVLDLGYSHEIRYPIPQGIKITRDARPPSRWRRGQAARRARSRRRSALSRPEPYKGKGIKYEGRADPPKEGKKK